MAPLSSGADSQPGHGGRRRYFRRGPHDRDPHVLLRADEQESTPWGEHEHGPFNKSGAVGYRCRSCIDGVLADCPACGGRCEFVDVCPACEGDGCIDRTRRDGVSVFPSADGLYRYIAERRAGTDGCLLLELEGELTHDRDLDAGAGALLIRPTRIVGVHPFDLGRLDELERQLAEGQPTLWPIRGAPV